MGTRCGAARFLLHDGGQPGQLLRWALLGISAAGKRQRPAACGLLQLRSEQLAGASVRDRGSLEQAVYIPAVRSEKCLHLYLLLTSTYFLLLTSYFFLLTSFFFLMRSGGFREGGAVQGTRDVGGGAT